MNVYSSESELSDTDLSDQYSSPSSSELSADEEESAVSCDSMAVQVTATEPGPAAGERQDKKKERVPGVVYLSRVPPYMKAHKLKHLLCPYGKVGRIYLQPEGI